MIFWLLSAFRLRISLVATVGVALVVSCGALRAKGTGEVPGEGHDIFIFSDVADGGPIPEWKCASALEAWERELSEKIGEEVRVSIVPSVQGGAGLKMMGTPSVAVVPVVEMGRCEGMIPEFLVEHEDGLYSKFMLIAPRGGVIVQGDEPTQVGLFDSSITMTWNGRVWARSILPDVETGLFRVVPESGGVVIPVFFGRAAYGVVDKEGFQAEILRNPQVEDKVEVIAESPPMLGNAVLIREDLRAPMAEKIRRELALSSKGKNGAIVFSVLGWRALRPVEEKEVELISENLAMLAGDDEKSATAEMKGGKK